MSWFSNLFNTNKKRIYLDYAAATPVLPEVANEMAKYFSREFYNPSAIYQEGVRVSLEVGKFRRKIAEITGAREENVIFTSGGTEANTLAVRGVQPGKIIIETDCHPSVLEATKGIKGKLTTLISSITTDNKLGRQIREERKKKNSEFPLLHIDASQSANYYSVGLETLACDLLTLDSAKLYGPKGIGALIIRKGVGLDLPPLGTPPVPLIAGMARALELAARDREREFGRLSSLSEEFIKLVKLALPEAEIAFLKPNQISVSIPPILPELLVLALDREGLMVSAGPACNSNKPEPRDTPVRLSLGRFTTRGEVERASKIFCQTAKNLLKSNHESPRI